MLWEALGGARDLGRMYDIASVLVRFGFGDLVQRVGMAAFIERVTGSAAPESSPSAMWRSVRHTPQARTRTRTIATAVAASVLLLEEARKLAMRVLKHLRVTREQAYGHGKH